MLRKGSIATKESTQSLSLDTETLFPSPLSSYCLGQYFPLVSGDRLERVRCVFQFLFLSHSLNFFFPMDQGLMFLKCLLPGMLKLLQLETKHLVVPLQPYRYSLAKETSVKGSREMASLIVISSLKSTRSRGKIGKKFGSMLKLK